MSLSSGICFIQFLPVLKMLQLAKDPEARKNVLSKEYNGNSKKLSGREEIWSWRAFWYSSLRRWVWILKAIVDRNQLFKVKFHWAKRTGKELIWGEKELFWSKTWGMKLALALLSCCGGHCLWPSERKTAGIGGPPRARDERRTDCPVER